MGACALSCGWSPGCPRPCHVLADSDPELTTSPLHPRKIQAVTIQPWRFSWKDTSLLLLLAVAIPASIRALRLSFVAVPRGEERRSAPACACPWRSVARAINTLVSELLRGVTPRTEKQALVRWHTHLAWRPRARQRLDCAATKLPASPMLESPADRVSRARLKSTSPRADDSMHVTVGSSRHIPVWQGLSRRPVACWRLFLLSFAEGHSAA
jgi:hypothetical protein